MCETDFFGVFERTVSVSCQYTFDVFDDCV